MAALSFRRHPEEICVFFLIQIGQTSQSEDAYTRLILRALACSRHNEELEAEDISQTADH